MIYPKEQNETADDVEEVLGATPSWILTRGTTVIFIAVLAIVLFSCLIKYPDIVIAQVKLTTKNPPSTVEARSSGKVQRLLVRNGAFVTKNQKLAIIESTAHYEDIESLGRQLKQVKVGLYNPIPNFSTLEEGGILGPVQSSFNDFLVQYLDLKNYILLDVVGKQIDTYKQQILNYEKYISLLSRRLANQKKIYQINVNVFKRDSILLKSKTISNADFERSLQSLFSSENDLETIKAQIESTSMDKAKISYQVSDLENQKIEKINQMVTSVRGALKSLEGAITEWDKTFIIRSPIAGKITFNNYWVENQSVQTGNNVFTIIPTNTKMIIGRAKLSILRSGKVKIGQRVNIKLNNYPYEEYGIVNATINNISLVPERDNKEDPFYTVEMTLPYGLKTSYNKTLPFQQEMEASGEIITNTMSVFSRFIQPIAASFDAVK